MAVEEKLWKESKIMGAGPVPHDRGRPYFARWAEK